LVASALVDDPEGAARLHDLLHGGATTADIRRQTWGQAQMLAIMAGRFVARPLAPCEGHSLREAGRPIEGAAESPREPLRPARKGLQVLA
jgi:hypothetical protein